MAAVAGLAGDRPFVLRWSFRTRHAACDPLAQDCGLGRGCFLEREGPTCLWAGRSGPGAVCRYANDCAPGLHCLGSRCLPLCPLGAGAGECDTECVHGSRPLVADLGVCLRPSCLDPSGACGEGEGCYWSLAFQCDTAGTAEPGEPCAEANACAPGNVCVGSEDRYTCRRLCGARGFPRCQDACAAEAVELEPERGAAYCTETQGL